VTPAAARAAAMRRSNPAVVPRNWVLQVAIEAAERGDLGVVRRVLDALTRPFDDRWDARDEADEGAWLEVRGRDGAARRVHVTSPPPEEYQSVVLTCSS